MKAPAYFTALALGLLINSTSAQSVNSQRPNIIIKDTDNSRAVEKKTPAAPNDGHEQVFDTAIQQANVLVEEREVKGQVRVEFVIDSTGKVGDVKVVKSTSPAPSPMLSFEQYCNLITAIAAITALGFTVLQIRKNTKATNAQTLSGLYNRLLYINHTLIEKPDIATRLKTPFVAENDLGSPTSLYIDTVKNFFHEMYIYHKAGLVDKPEWESWKGVIEEFCTELYFRKYWQYQSNKPKPVTYSSGLHKLIKEIIEKYDKEQMSKNTEILSSDQPVPAA